MNTDRKIDELAAWATVRISELEAALVEVRRERDAARRERDEVREGCIPMLDDDEAYKQSCIAAGVDYTTERFVVIDTLANRLAAAVAALAERDAEIERLRERWTATRYTRSAASSTTPTETE